MSEDAVVTTETEEDQEKAQEIAASIIDQLRKSKKLHDQFADKFRTQYKVAGKLMSEWKEHFKVSLPPDLNPQLAQQTDAQLVELHQEATFLKAEAEARLTAYQSANNERYRSKYAALVAEYKAGGAKLPAKDTLAALAENATADIKDAMSHAEIELAFWKEVLNDISNSRKLLENATICMATEAKAIQYNNYLDRINTKKEY
jgi:hypothetical protein